MNHLRLLHSNELVNKVYFFYFAGSSYGNSGNLHLSFQTPVILKPGENEIAILSMTIGMYVSSYFGFSEL